MLTLAQASDMVIAGIAALSGLLADPGQAPADPPFAAKATARAGSHPTFRSRCSRSKSARSRSIVNDT